MKRRPSRWMAGWMCVRAQERWAASRPYSGSTAGQAASLSTASSSDTAVLRTFPSRSGRIVQFNSTNFNLGFLSATFRCSKQRNYYPIVGFLWPLSCPRVLPVVDPLPPPRPCLGEVQVPTPWTPPPAPPPLTMSRVPPSGRIVYGF